MATNKPATPANETPEARFKRLASSRVNRAIAALRPIANLANPASYKYTPDQARKIIKALEGEVNGIAAAFANPEQAKGSGSFQV